MPIWRTELLTTPQLGWLLLCYAVVALLSIGIIRWANCRVKRMPSLWAIGIFIIALLPRLFVLLALRAPAFGGALFGQMNLSVFILPENLTAILYCAISALSAVVVYLIARRFDDGSARAAGLLLALYPANIVLCASQPVLQIVVLFALLSVMFAIRRFPRSGAGRRCCLRHW
ncbi:MAG: hypothetical protein R2912_04445 [Eubacteriales bacterium]